MFAAGDFSNVIGFVVGVAAFAVMSVTGLQVLRGSRWFPWFVPVTLVAQIPVIAGGRFSYGIMSFPKVEWQLWPLFGGSIATEAKMTILFDNGDRPFSLAINLLAVFLLVWTDRHLGEADALSGATAHR
jgi:hypothetical protein